MTGIDRDDARRGEEQRREQRDRRLLVALGVNSVVSVAAVVISVVALTRGGSSRAAVVASGSPGGAVSPAVRAQLVLPAPAAIGGGGARVAQDDGAEGLHRGAPHGPARLAMRQSAVHAPESTVALAQKLGLNANVLAEQIGDADGTLPKASAARLERAFDAAKAFAKRRDLDDAGAQSVATLFTGHVFSVLRAEKAAGDKGVDAATLDDITSETTSGLNATLREDVAKEAEAEVAHLR